MLRWRDVRPLIGETVGRQLLPLGFVNPGRAMWRYREHFVDVVAFRCEKYAQGFSFEIGCTLRSDAPPHPDPSRCDLRASDLPLSRTDRVHPYIPFERDVDAQRAKLELMAPLVAAEAARWLAPFETLEKAIEHVERDAGVAGLSARPGSPAHMRVIARLRDALSRPTR